MNASRFFKSPTFLRSRNMATLKEISLRLKSVENIGKITKSMKMIASTKVTKAQQSMNHARAFAEANYGLVTYTKTNETEMKKPLLIACSSDRGLCGGIHSSVAKSIKKKVNANPNAKVAVLGAKARGKMALDYSKSFALTFDGVLKFTAQWQEAAVIADRILAAKIENDGMQIVYNHFRNVISFDTVGKNIPSYETIKSAENLASYEIEDDVLENYHQFILGNQIFCSLAEGFAAEICSRRTAMENATKNAEEMVKKLTLTFNRSRQAVITNDLCDIITGASALD